MSILSSFLYLSFDLYSPSPEEGLGDEFDLIDHSDLHILDFSKYTYSKVLLPSGSLWWHPGPNLFLGFDYVPVSHSSSEGPSLKTLCKLAVIQYNLDQSCLPHDIRYSEWLERRDWLRVSGSTSMTSYGRYRILVENEMEGDIDCPLGKLHRKKLFFRRSSGASLPEIWAYTVVSLRCWKTLIKS